MTDRRPPALDSHDSSDRWTWLDLADAAADIGRLSAGSERQRSARSLFQTTTLGAVLTNLAAGSSMENEQPDEAVTIQGILGECTLEVDTEALAVRPGTLVAVRPGIPWRLDAIADATVLTTVARPRP